MRNLDYVATFIKVVESGSFTKAASSQSISRAAVSKQIRLLEGQLGVHLLDRSTRTVELTHEGRLVYEQCCSIMSSVDSLQAMLSGLKAEPSGQLSVVCGPVFAHKYIVPNLNNFLKRYPKISLVLDFRHLMPNLVEENIDVVIAVYGSAPPDAVQRCVLRTRRILCASKAYLKKAGTPKKPEDLLKYPVIIHPLSPKNSCIELAKGKQFDVHPSIIMNDQLAIKQCALNSAGICYIQRHVVSDELQKGTLVELLTEYTDQEDSIPLYVHYMGRRFLHSKVQAFLDFIESVLHQ